mgnify:CR=1 FL=1
MIIYIYKEIDTLKDEAYQASEVVLNDITAEAFALIKETAKRFVHNTSITVKATPFDRELSAAHDYVTLDGENAIWKNSWDAAGKPITWDMVHYDVQLIGGMILHRGKIAEMATGEGKTLTISLAAYLNALLGKGVHIVTVNDYLAKRDSQEMGAIYQFLGLTSGYINNDQDDNDRKKNYNFKFRIVLDSTKKSSKRRND